MDSAAELEARRRRAAEYFQERKPLREIARAVGRRVCSSVKRWKAAWKTGGVDALAAKPHPAAGDQACPRSRNNSWSRLLLAGPLAAGYRTDLWTCARVAEVVRKQFRVYSTIRTMWGGSCTTWASAPQKPRQVAREQDPEAVERWRREDWPRIKKKPERRGASIVFIDETGFRLQPVNRRTWAPRGETPVQRAWDRYDRLSVIGAVALSPTRRRISLGEWS